MRGWDILINLVCLCPREGNEQTDGLTGRISLTDGSTFQASSGKVHP